MPTKEIPAVPFARYRLTVQPLTAIHIGSADTIAPYEYDIELNQQDRYGVLTVYDLNRFLSQLDPRQRDQFLKLTDQAEMRSLRRWLRNTADPERHRQYRVLVSWSAAQDLDQAMDDIRREGTIHLHQRDSASKRLMIPGSSIKGAIRTAVADRLRRELGDDRLRSAARDKRRGQRFEGELFGYGGNFRRDPFRQLAIGDIFFDSSSACVERIISVRENEPEPKESQIRMYREVLMGAAYYGRDDRGEGDVRLASHLADPRCLPPIYNRRRGAEENVHLSHAFSIQQIIDDCNNFYRPICQAECTRFAVTRATPFSSGDHVRKVLTQELTLADTQCLIRLGHHSHFDSMTINGNFREPPRNYTGRLRWFASGVVPLGWAILTFQPHLVP